MTATLLDLINRKPVPAPWSEGDNIPWDDPEFSERMLAEHLSQDHDLASRKEETIELQVEWIFSGVLGSGSGSGSAKLLDLACGPGLYTSRLAARGCECVGVDFSPASIRHAEQVAAETSSGCTYRHADLRAGNFGHGFDLAMMLYGQLNVFPRHQGLEILKNAHAALRPGGALLLEVQTPGQIQQGGQSAPTWYSVQSGLFSPDPHLVLQESFWDAETTTSTIRFSAIDGETGRLSTYALSNEAYTEAQLTEALTAAGFNEVKRFPSLRGEAVAGEQDLPAIVARK